MSYHKKVPETALQKAKDFVAAGRELEGLRSLNAFLGNRKNRTWQETHQKIMFYYTETALNLYSKVIDTNIDLSVRLRIETRQAFVNYRSVCSNYGNKYHNTSNYNSQQRKANFPSLLACLKNFREETENKIDEVVASLENEGKNTVLELMQEDLEEETPEALIARAMSSDENGEASKRVSLSPWIKYMWEAYKTILEVLKNNSKLQEYYHDTCRAVFKFCHRFGRVQEFRRQAEMMRHQLAYMEKNSKQVNSVNLNSKETQRLYLETRFAQLKIASEMELWQEAYRCIHDIDESMRMADAPPSADLERTYHDTLAKIFWASNNYLFHALSLLKLYQLSTADSQDEEAALELTDEERTELANRVVIATVIINPRDGNPDLYDESKAKSNRELAMLLGLKHVEPSRDSLVSYLTGSELVANAEPFAQEIFNLLEHSFGPLTLSKSLSKLVRNLEDHPILDKYHGPLNELSVLRLAQQLARVFKSIKIQKFIDLAPLDDWLQMERLLLNTNSWQQVSVRVDHHLQMLYFIEEPMQVSHLRTELSTMSMHLQAVADKIAPVKVEDKQEERKRVFEAVREGIEPERQSMFDRQAEINKRKQEEDEALKMRAGQARKKKEQEALKLQAETENELKKKEQDRAAEKAKTAEESREKMQLAHTIKQNLLDVLDMEKKQLLDGQETKAVKQQKEVEQWLVNLAAVDKQTLQDRMEEVDKRLVRLKKQASADKRNLIVKADYTERAYRTEEQSLLEKFIADQKQADITRRKAEFEEYVNESKLIHVERLKDKVRLAKYSSYKQKFHDDLMARRQKIYQAEMKEWEAATAARERELEKRRREKEELERKAALEKARAAQVEADRLAQARENEKLRAEQQKKRDEQAAKAAAREAEMEAKIQADKERLLGRSAPRGREPEADEGRWRRGGGGGGLDRDDGPRRGGFDRDDGPRRGGDDDEPGPWRRAGGSRGGPRAFDRDDAPRRSGFSDRDASRGGFDRNARGGDRDAPRRRSPVREDNDEPGPWRRPGAAGRDAPRRRSPLRGGDDRSRRRSPASRGGEEDAGKWRRGGSARGGRFNRGGDQPSGERGRESEPPSSSGDGFTVVGRRRK